MIDERDDSALDAELRALRASLRTLHAPPHEERLLAAARRARARVASPPAVSVPRRKHEPVAALGLAAVITLAALAALLAAAVQPPPRLAAATAPLDAAAQVGDGAAFQPLLYGPGLSHSRSYDVVRVRIPLAALAAARGAPLSGSIEADLLVGEDGLASAIRFDAADTLFVATVGQ
jgi:hypothetical protein